MKAAEGVQYSTDQAIKLEMELVELKAERTVMSLRVSNVKSLLTFKKPTRRFVLSQADQPMGATVKKKFTLTVAPIGWSDCVIIDWAIHFECISIECCQTKIK